MLLFQGKEFIQLNRGELLVCSFFVVVVEVSRVRSHKGRQNKRRSTSIHEIEKEGVGTESQQQVIESAFFSMVT